MANLARRGVASTAIGGALICRNVFRTCHAFASARLISSHFLRAPNFVSCDPIAMAGGRHANLGWCGGRWSALTERLENLCTEIFRTSDGTTSAGLITRRLDGAIGLRTCHSLASSGLRLTHLPVSISGGGLLGSVSIWASWTRYSSALLAAGSGLRAKLTHLLRQLSTGEIRIGLTGHCGSTCGLFPCCFSVFRHRFTTSQHKGTAWVVDGTSLWSFAPARRIVG